MTREEQIAEAAVEWTSEHGEEGEYQISLDCIQEVAFEAGAEWSDKNPIVINWDKNQCCRDLDDKLAVAIGGLQYISGIDCGCTASKVANEALAKIEGDK